MKPEIMKCPLPELSLPAGSTVTIVSDRVSPGNIFYPTGFILDPKVADQLLVQDIRVGRNSQLMGIGGIPASLFSAARSPIKIRLEAITSGFAISLKVVNTGPPVIFSGSVVGSSRKPASVLSMVLGWGNTEVKTSATIIVYCQYDFEPQRLFVPPQVLKDFDIEYLQGEKYLDSSEVSKVPPDMLTATSISDKGGSIHFEPISKVGRGTSLTIAVLNRAKSSRCFNAAVLGIPLE